MMESAINFLPCGSLFACIEEHLLEQYQRRQSFNERRIRVILHCLLPVEIFIELDGKGHCTADAVIKGYDLQAIFKRSLSAVFDNTSPLDNS